MSVKRPRGSAAPGAGYPLAGAGGPRAQRYAAEAAALIERWDAEGRPEIAHWRAEAELTGDPAQPIWAPRHWRGDPGKPGRAPGARAHLPRPPPRGPPPPPAPS